MTPLLSLLCASLEGEGAEVSAAVQALGHGAWNTTKGCRSGSFQANCPELKHVLEITGMRGFEKKQTNQNLLTHPAVTAASFPEVP